MKRFYKKLASSTPLQFKMVIGASALTLLLLSVLTFGTYMHPDPMWWATPGLAYTIGIICFAFRQYNWCDIKHLLIPL